VRSKQRSIEALGEDQRMRKSAIRTDLLRIFGVLPSRSLLRNKTPVDEVARGELPYEPFEKGVLMIRDGATAARGLASEKQDQLRNNVHEFCVTLERYMLEPLDSLEETDVIPLLLEETRVQSQLDPVEDLAKLHRTPETLINVARGAERQARISSRLADACWTAANRVGLTLVRPTKLQAVRS
jgi:hypothetical protein